MKSKRSNKTILVVDDDIDYLHQQQLRLEAAGYRVMAAEGQKQAEELLEQHLPDLAVIDLMMENQDGGFTLCYHIKKKKASIPVIVVSGVESETGLEFDATTSEERSWIKADKFLAKPVRFEQLLGEIDRLLRG